MIDELKRASLLEPGDFDVYDGKHYQAADAGHNERPPEFSDDALALRFTEKHGDDFKFVTPFGKWFRWNGTCWREDKVTSAFDQMRKLCREVSLEPKTPMKSIASAKTVAAVERLAKTDGKIATDSDVWDGDPWLLTTPAGAIDLRTGQQRPLSRADYSTKMTNISPGGECPIWLRFLDRITGGDTHFQAFLARIAGYALTGSTREHALFFLFGTGANGKSVFLNTLSHIAGEYHRTAPIEAFLSSKSERHPTELAFLKGARMVTAIETEEGRRWDEAKIKALTGGDPIAARFMRQDFFEFTPQFKLLIAGNHRPQLRNVDEAIRRRFHLLPFEVTIPENERDEDLPQKLRAEAAGILEWAIRGAVEWNRTGLNPPDRVKQATKEYLTDEDPIAQWITDKCYTAPNYSNGSTELYKSYKEWSRDVGEYSLSQKRFSQALVAHGFIKDRTRNGTTFRGLHVRSEWTL